MSGLDALNDSRIQRGLPHARSGPEAWEMFCPACEKSFPATDQVDALNQAIVHASRSCPS